MKKRLNLLAVFILVSIFIVPSSFAEEKITLTTYYPAPYGIYKELRADQMAVGSTYRNSPLSDGQLFVSGNVGIGTTVPSQALDVVGRTTIHPSGTGVDNAYNGNLVIVKPAASGQYINLIRSGRYPWSIGTVYNSNTFAIGTGLADDTLFMSPQFVMKTDGNVGIGTTNPQAKLDVNGDFNLTGIAKMYVQGGSSSAAATAWYTGTSNVDIWRWYYNGTDNWASIGTRTLQLWAYPYDEAGGCCHQMMGFTAGASDKMWINGNVGINTNDPKSTLDVRGTTNVCVRVNFGPKTGAKRCPANYALSIGTALPQVTGSHTHTYTYYKYEGSKNVAYTGTTAAGGGDASFSTSGSFICCRACLDDDMNGVCD